MKLDKDEILKVLKDTYGPVIEETEDYRPLVGYILSLCKAYAQAMTKPLAEAILFDNNFLEFDWNSNGVWFCKHCGSDKAEDGDYENRSIHNEGCIVLEAKKILGV